jgi:RNA polymerase sigma factor (sigma-70 family)
VPPPGPPVVHGLDRRHRGRSISLVPTERSDGELLLAAKDGDEVAWDLLVRRITPRLFNAARGIGLDTSDAKDVCQVAWLRLCSHMADIRDPEKVGAWLATVVRHEGYRMLRRAGRSVPLPIDEEGFEPDPGGQPEVDAGLLRTEREADLLKAMSQLPTRCQLLLRLLMADPRPSYEEVAAALDTTVGSIGPTRGRCIELLRSRLGRINGDDGGSTS